jgi:hypothetical protein
MQQPSVLKAGALAGLAAAAVFVLPIIQLLNCACCAPLVGTGVLGAWLFARQPIGPDANPAFTAGDGALAGAVTGLFGGVMATIISFVAGTSSDLKDRDELRRQILESLPDDADAATREQVLRMADGMADFFSSTGGSFLAVLLFMLVLFTATCTVGGLLGSAFFRNRPVTRPPGSGGFGENGGEGAIQKLPWE